MHFTGLQLRAARGLLRITAEQLSKLAGVSSVTIRRAELEDGPVTMSATNVFAVQKALLNAGVVFIEAEDGVGGPGVRLKWGFVPAKAGATQGAATSQGDTGALDALGWDWEGDASDTESEDIGELDWTDEDRADQIEHWRSRPEAWARLHEVSRQCLLRAMGVERL
jgi:transcriptional regulator with XRE-family HTH domain